MNGPLAYIERKIIKEKLRATIKECGKMFSIDIAISIKYIPNSKCHKNLRSFNVQLNKLEI